MTESSDPAFTDYVLFTEVIVPILQMAELGGKSLIRACDSPLVVLLPAALESTGTLHQLC